MGSTATFDWSFDDLYGSIGDPEGPRGLRGMFRGPRGSRQTSRVLMGSTGRIDGSFDDLQGLYVRETLT